MEVYDHKGELRFTVKEVVEKETGDIIKIKAHLFNPELHQEIKEEPEVKKPKRGRPKKILT